MFHPILSCLISPDFPEGPDDRYRLVAVVPALARFPPELALLMAHLPLVSANQMLREALAGAAPQRGHRTFAGILAVDPFACWDDLAEDLREAGITGIANFPSVTSLDEVGLRSLRGAGLGFDEEMARLDWFRERGFRCLAFVSNREQGQQACSRIGDALEAICLFGPTALASANATPPAAVALTQTDVLLRSGAAGSDYIPILSWKERQV